MSDLTFAEKRLFERLLGMESGYLLNFSDRTFSEFVGDSIGLDIYDEKYKHASGSKANRMRGFWQNEESNRIVGKLMADFLDYVEREYTSYDTQLLADCHRAVSRLLQSTAVPEIDALTPNADGNDFDIIAKQVREAIEKNQPEVGLDRLHTFVIKFVRNLCERSGIVVTREKALQSLFGEYVKKLKAQGQIESEMTERILKSTVSVLDAFNHVRNNQSLAHDNPILNYEESLLIFNHVASSIRFLRNLESRSTGRSRAEQVNPPDGDEIPF
jgi:hypothetical protein